MFVAESHNPYENNYPTYESFLPFGISSCFHFSKSVSLLRKDPVPTICNRT